MIGFEDLQGNDEDDVPHIGVIKNETNSKDKKYANDHDKKMLL